MNLKKYLQQQAEKDAENLLTEEDKLFCMQLSEKIQEQPVLTEIKKPKAKLWASLSSAFAVALVAVIVIPVVLSRNGEVYYKEENISQRVCQLEELNSNLKSFQVVQNDNAVIRNEVYYDTVSKDNLYYSINVTTSLSEFDLYIVVNKNYNYEFNLNNELLSEQLTDYIINYEYISNDEFGKIDSKYLGVIQINTEIVYIDYTQSIDLGKQAFFDDIQNVLKAKN